MADLSQLFTAPVPRGAMAGYAQALEDEKTRAGIGMDLANTRNISAMANKMEQMTPYDVRQASATTDVMTDPNVVSARKMGQVGENQQAYAKGTSAMSGIEPEKIANLVKTMNGYGNMAIQLGSRGGSGKEAYDMLVKTYSQGLQSQDPQERAQAQETLAKLEKSGVAKMTPQQLTEWGKNTVRNYNKNTLEYMIAELQGQYSVDRASLSSSNSMPGHDKAIAAAVLEEQKAKNALDAAIKAGKDTSQVMSIYGAAKRKRQALQESRAQFAPVVKPQIEGLPFGDVRNQGQMQQEPMQQTNFPIGKVNKPDGKYRDKNGNPIIVRDGVAYSAK